MAGARHLADALSGGVQLGAHRRRLFAGAAQPYQDREVIYLVGEKDTCPFVSSNPCPLNAPCLSCLAVCPLDGCDDMLAVVVSLIERTPIRLPADSPRTQPRSFVCRR